MIGKRIDLRAGSGARPPRPGPALRVFPFILTCLIKPGFREMFLEDNPAWRRGQPLIKEQHFVGLEQGVGVFGPGAYRPQLVWPQAHQRHAAPPPAARSASSLSSAASPSPPNPMPSRERN